MAVHELPVAQEEAIMLQQLRTLLVDYCTAGKRERAALARQIREHAKSLSNGL